MSKKKAAMQNAEKIIEKFGGIRPMAKKLDVAVTTVQGWKKRGTIPAARRTKIIEAADAHNIDLESLVAGKSAPENTKPANTNAFHQSAPKTEHKTKDTPPPEDEKAEPIEEKKTEANSKNADIDTKPTKTVAETPIIPQPKNFDDKLAQMEHNAIAKSTWITVFLLLISLGGAFLYLFPKNENLPPIDDKRIQQLEHNVNALQNDVNNVKSSQSFLKTIIPPDLDQRIASIQEKAESAVNNANNAIDEAQNIVRDTVNAASTGDMSERLAAIENSIDELRGSPEIAAFIDKLTLLDNSYIGSEQLNRSMEEIKNALKGVNNNNTTEENTPEAAEINSKTRINQALDAARNQSAALSQTFENVPQDNLKAAALLLSMTQFRKSLNRDNVAFADDLAVVQKLVGDENPELTASLNNLAPYAESGVLTPSGLTNELKTISGEIVVDSLTGENVSIKDKFKARLNELVQIEKDGELLSGTETQATLARSETLLQSGDINGAVNAMKAIEAQNPELISPWINKATATLKAQNTNQMIKSSLQKLTPKRGANAPLYVPQ